MQATFAVEMSMEQPQGVQQPLQRHKPIEESPIVTCGVYYNPDDPRVCVCGREKTSCNRPTPAANIGTTGGKFICLIYVLALVAVLVGGAIFKSGSDKGDRKEED